MNKKYGTKKSPKGNDSTLNSSVTSKYSSSPNEYSEACQRRYQLIRRCYQEQFQRELRAMVALQPSALDAVRLERAFQRVIVRPLVVPPRYVFSRAEKARLSRLLDDGRVRW